MADSFGGLCDKVVTVCLKIRASHESLINLIEKKPNYDGASIVSKEIFYTFVWKCIKKLADLHMQKDVLITEIDSLLDKMIIDAKAGKDLDNGSYIQRKHKTY